MLKNVLPKADCALILFSGGIESGLLLKEMRDNNIEPIICFVDSGLYWDAVAEKWARAFVALLGLRAPLIKLRVDLAGANDWFVTGTDVPTGDRDSRLIEIPGRNLTLLAAVMPTATATGCRYVMMGTAQPTVFPDTSAEFFENFERTASMAIGRSVETVHPYYDLSKTDVLKRAPAFPWESTFSCFAPRGDEHCGTCLKCTKRRLAFRSAAVLDRTRYCSQ